LRQESFVYCFLSHAWGRSEGREGIGQRRAGPEGREEGREKGRKVGGRKEGMR